LALLPLDSGVAYEIVKLTRKFKSGLMLVLVYPGLMMQKITTREPDAGQIEWQSRPLKEVV